MKRKYLSHNRLIKIMHKNSGESYKNCRQILKKLFWLDDEALLKSIAFDLQQKPITIEFHEPDFLRWNEPPTGVVTGFEAMPLPDGFYYEKNERS